MNSIDTFCLVVIAFNVLLGLIRGAAWQIMRLAAIVLGVWCALEQGDRFLSMWPTSWQLTDTAASILARVVVFFSVYLVMFGLTHLARALIDRVRLGGVDRILGGIVGILKGAAFCSVLLYLQFLPPVNEIGIVRDQLYGNPEQDLPPSVANELFIAYLKPRIETAVPKDLSERVEDITRERAWPR